MMPSLVRTGMKANVRQGGLGRQGSHFNGLDRDKALEFSFDGITEALERKNRIPGNFVTL